MFQENDPIVIEKQEHVLHSDDVESKITPSKKRHWTKNEDSIYVHGILSDFVGECNFNQERRITRSAKNTPNCPFQNSEKSDSLKLESKIDVLKGHHRNKENEFIDEDFKTENSRRSTRIQEFNELERRSEVTLLKMRKNRERKARSYQTSRGRETAVISLYSNSVQDSCDESDDTLSRHGCANNSFNSAASIRKSQRKSKR